MNSHEQELKGLLYPCKNLQKGQEAGATVSWGFCVPRDAAASSVSLSLWEAPPSRESQARCSQQRGTGNVEQAAWNATAQET